MCIVKDKQFHHLQDDQPLVLVLVFPSSMKMTWSKSKIASFEFGSKNWYNVQNVSKAEHISPFKMGKKRLELCLSKSFS